MGNASVQGLDVHREDEVLGAREFEVLEEVEGMGGVPDVGGEFLGPQGDNRFKAMTNKSVPNYCPSTFNGITITKCPTINILRAIIDQKLELDRSEARNPAYMKNSRQKSVRTIVNEIAIDDPVLHFPEYGDRPVQGKWTLLAIYILLGFSILLSVVILVTGLSEETSRSLDELRNDVSQLTEKLGTAGLICSFLDDFKDTFPREGRRPVWVSSGCSSFLPQSKDVQVWWLAMLKLPVVCGSQQLGGFLAHYDTVDKKEFFSLMEGSMTGCICL
eukprot:g47313.t1